jgi:hypothetical protein
MNIFDPPAIISEAPQYKKQNKKNDSLSFKDKLKNHLFFGSIKYRGNDGRTYNYIDKNGEHVSSFLSPYNSKILDNVEPKIKNLVKILINKGYLTASSCQGHPYDDIHIRYITIAFINEEEKINFISKINSFKLPIYWYENFLNFKENPKKPENREGMTMAINMKDVNFTSIESLRESGYSKKDLIDFWNIMFSRNYDEYHAVSMFICSCPGDISWIERFKIKFQWPLRDYYTKKITKKFEKLDNYVW